MSVSILSAWYKLYVDDSEVYKYPVQDIMTEEFSTQSPQLMSERVRTLTALAHPDLL
jgi:transcription-repair coupling factor (superfamily II helicase)